MIFDQQDPSSVTGTVQQQTQTAPTATPLGTDPVVRERVAVGAAAGRPGASVSATADDQFSVTSR
jgi:hypothetical protein